MRRIEQGSDPLQNSGQGSGAQRSGGIFAGLASILAVAGGLVLGSFVLVFGAILAVAAIIAFFIWRTFFAKRTIRKMKERMAENLRAQGIDPQSMGLDEGMKQTGPGEAPTSSNTKGPTIDGDYERL